MLNKKSEMDIINKWSEVLGPMGLTGSKLEGISQLLQNQENNLVGETSSEGFPSLFPFATKVSSQLMSNDLVFASKEEIDEVKKKVQSENRDGKIEAIIEGVDFVEKKLEDDPQYKELMKKGVTPLQAPSGVLHYLDYQYAEKSHKKTRRAGKKHKKMKKYVSPGVHTMEVDTSEWKYPKQWIRKWKISRVFDLEIGKVLITSTPKGITYLPKV